MIACRNLSSAAVGFALAVLMVSYGAIALYTSTPWLWSTTVHESGDRTLLETILYYEHAARELPLDLILGIAVGAGALFVFPAPQSHRIPRIRFLSWCVLVVSGVIVAGTIWTGGFVMLYENLFQFPTRPGAPLTWGGHWRYHLLSHLSLLCLSFGMAGPVLVAAGRRTGHRRGLVALAAAFGLFMALTVLFVPGAESFRDPLFIGHQAREVFTHVLVSIPLAWGVCIWLARHEWTSTTSGSAPAAPAFIAGASGALIAMFLVVASLATSAASQGQSDSLAVLIFPHFFEHTFSYVMTTLTAALMFELA